MMERWGTAMRAAIATGVVVSTTIAVMVGILGLAFVPRSEFRAVAKLAQFTACTVVLDVETCQKAHNVTLDDLLGEVKEVSR